MSKPVLVVLESPVLAQGVGQGEAPNSAVSVADPDSPLLLANDLGAARGDGVFETILVVKGKPIGLKYHLERFSRSAELLNLSLPDFSAWQAAVRLTIEEFGEHPEFGIKLVLTRGPEGSDAPTGWVTAFQPNPTVLRQRTAGISAVTLTRGYPLDIVGQAPWLLLGAKTLSYSVNMAALREAKRRGADDVVFYSTDGFVLEGPTSSAVIARGKTLITPDPQETGILPGTTQRLLFEAAPSLGWQVSYEPIRVEDLHQAEALWLLSSVRGVTAVKELDGKAIPVNAETTEAFNTAFLNATGS